MASKRHGQYREQSVENLGPVRLTLQPMYVDDLRDWSHNPSFLLEMSMALPSCVNKTFWKTVPTWRSPENYCVGRHFLLFPSTSSLFTIPPLLTLFQASGIGGRKKSNILTY